MSTKPNKNTKSNTIVKHPRLTNLQYRRIQGGKLIEQGYRNREIVEILGCSLSSVKHWRRIVKEQGVDALAPQTRSGRPSKLTTKQLAKLQRLLKKGATKFGYANAIWTSRCVRQLIKDQFNIVYSKAQTCRILRKVGYSPQTP